MNMDESDIRVRVVDFSLFFINIVLTDRYFLHWKSACTLRVKDIIDNLSLVVHTNDAVLYVESNGCEFIEQKWKKIIQRQYVLDKQTNRR